MVCTCDERWTSTWHICISMTGWTVFRHFCITMTGWTVCHTVVPLWLVGLYATRLYLYDYTVFHKFVFLWLFEMYVTRLYLNDWLDCISHICISMVDWTVFHTFESLWLIGLYITRLYLYDWLDGMGNRDVTKRCARQILARLLRNDFKNSVHGKYIMFGCHLGRLLSPPPHTHTQPATLLGVITVIAWICHWEKVTPAWH